MFATTAIASAPISPTATHSSARRRNNSKLIREISASNASLRRPARTCASTTAPIAAGTYTVRLRPPAYTARYVYGPCNSPRRHRQPALEHRRPSRNSTPGNVRSTSDQPAVNRRRRATSCDTLKPLKSTAAISL
jgi:hypothetical protein